MRFYISNVPYEASYRNLYQIFRPYLNGFTCIKQRGKGFAILTVNDEEEGRRFLAQYAGPRPRETFRLGGRTLKIDIYRSRRPNESNDQDLLHRVHANDDDDDDDDDDIVIKVKYLEMGMWTSSSMSFEGDNDLGDTYFSSEWSNISDLWPYPRFSISNSKRAIDIIIDDHIVHIPFGIVEPFGIYFSKPKNNPNRQEIFIELCQPPEFRRKLPLSSLLQPKRQNKDRVSGIPGLHQRLAGICLVYKCTFDNVENQSNLYDEAWKVLIKHELADPSLPINDIRTVTASHYAPRYVIMATMMMRSFPVQVAFQVQAIISSGYMFPSEAADPTFGEVIRSSLQQHSIIAVAEAIRQLGIKVKLHYDTFKSEEVDGTKIIGNRPNFRQSFLESLASGSRPLHATGHVILVNHVYVTPAGYILEGPIAERSNRVVRYYKRYSENFIRVSFTDEDSNKMGFEYGVTLDKIYADRFGSVLKNGIQVAGRTFEFLGFSNSSLRDHGCWFFAPSEQEYVQGPKVTVETIRRWMGDFSAIRCPARYASRMGQCFTSTVHAVSVPNDQIRRIDDIERDEYCFSDGIGKISRSLARHAWLSAISEKKTLMIPAIFQIRIGGAKGVVSIDPNLEGKVLCLRPSMEKFDAINSSDLEIAKPVTRWQVGYLNRPLILLLEHLGVPADIFLKWQRCAVKEVNDSVSSKNKARKLVKRFSARSHIGNVLIGCWKAGLDVNEYPLLAECLETLRKYALKMLQQRARIKVPHSFMLMGVLDETNTLGPGEVYICLKDWHRLQPGEKKNNESEHDTSIYGNDYDGDDYEEEEMDSERIMIQKRVLIGRVLVTRSPSLHPGDIQHFVAVACDQLAHLQNCIVFSQQGLRPGPNMLSGGDLDGDEFFVSLNSDLLFPPENLQRPADYPRVDPLNLDRLVDISDVAEFFLGFMQNDQLGRIANMHMAFADQKTDGPSDEKCLRLAELHSMAVDYPKTGRKADLTGIGRIELFPDFMSGTKSTGQRKNKGRQVYDSNRALGILYRDIEQQEEESSPPEPQQGRSRRRNGPPSSYASRQSRTDTLWERISTLEAAAGWQKHLFEARQLRDSFHTELRRIMTTQSPSRWKSLSESEAMTGCLVRDRHTRGKRNYDIENGITDAVSLLVSNYRERLVPSTENDEPLSSAESTSDEEFNGGFNDDDDDGDLVLYEAHQYNGNDEDNFEEDGRELDEEDYDELWSRLRIDRRQAQLREASSENGDGAVARAAAWYFVGAIENHQESLTSFAWVASDVLFRALREDKR